MIASPFCVSLHSLNTISTLIINHEKMIDHFSYDHDYVCYYDLSVFVAGKNDKNESRYRWCEDLVQVCVVVLFFAARLLRHLRYTS